MRQTELVLSEEDRVELERFRKSGVHNAREINRAHVLVALDGKVSESEIMRVLGIGRTAVWRTRSAYLEGGLKAALYDSPRPGKPPKYNTDDEAYIAALACSTPPKGAKRWTVAEIEIGILDRQCLGSRRCNLEALESEVSAWQDRRNREGRGIKWKFTRQDADRKLGK